MEVLKERVKWGFVSNMCFRVCSCRFLIDSSHPSHYNMHWFNAINDFLDVTIHYNHDPLFSRSNVVVLRCIQIDFRLGQSLHWHNRSDCSEWRWITPVITEGAKPICFRKRRLLLGKYFAGYRFCQELSQVLYFPKKRPISRYFKSFEFFRSSFIINSLRAMSIWNQFIHWIHTCLSISAFFMAVNGEL